MLKRIYITLTLLFFLQGVLFAQDENKANSLFKTAKSDYESLKYGPAIRALELVLKVHPEYTQAVAMLADSYRNIQDYKDAVIWYGKLTSIPNITIKPEWALHYAEVLANVGQYKKSGEWYTKYSAMDKKDNRADGFAKLYAGNMAELYVHQNEWKIQYLNMNTAASEFSPTYYKNGLMFTSNRKGKGIGSHVFEWDETPFTDLYYIKNLSEIKGINLDSIREVLRIRLKDSGKKLYKENDDDTYPTSNDTKIVGSYIIKMLKDTVGDYLSTLIDVEPMPGKINSTYHDGPTAMLPDGSILFNRNNYYHGKYAKSNEGINKLKLFTAKAPDYTDIDPFPYNNDQYSVGHPTLNKAGTLLIFASDMPGGSGASDLYYSKRATVKDAWGKPVNMGKEINTEGNELFPTLYQDSILYFSTNGRPGFGGLDIFKVTLNGTQPINKPTNIGAPVNSSVDDFGLIRSEDGTSGFFSSNRKGSDDIYGFTYHPFRIRLKGLVVDADSGQPLSNSMVAVKPEGKSFFQTGVAGTFDRPLATDINYTITATKDDYSGTDGVVSTKGITSDTTLTIVLKLRAKVELKAIAQTKIAPTPVIIKQLDCDTLRKLVAVKKIYWDLDKSFVRPDAEPELQYLMAVLSTHPELDVTLASHCDSRASGPYNIALSMRRSVSAKAYLLAHGVDVKRIKIEYYGKSRLTNKCADGVPCSEADQQLNRRTEFILTKNGKELQNVDCNWLMNYFNEKKPAPVAKVANCDSLHDMVAVRKIYYDLDKSFIRPDAHDELAHLMAVLNSHPQYQVILASHCDSRASGPYNIGLSMRRSRAARAYLLEHGIAASRMRIEYYGKSRLTNKCTDGVPCSEVDQQLNRRTEFILIYDGVELQNITCKAIQSTIRNEHSLAPKAKMTKKK